MSCFVKLRSRSGEGQVRYSLEVKTSDQDLSYTIPSPFPDLPEP